MYQLKILVKNESENGTLIDAIIPIPSIKFAQTKWAHAIIDALDTKGIMVDAVRETLKAALDNIDSSLLEDGGKAVLVDMNDKGVHIYVAFHSNEEKTLE